MNLSKDDSFDSIGPPAPDGDNGDLIPNVAEFNFNREREKIMSLDNVVSNVVVHQESDPARNKGKRRRISTNKNKIDKLTGNN